RRTIACAWPARLSARRERTWARSRRGPLLLSLGGEGPAQTMAAPGDGEQDSVVAETIQRGAGEQRIAEEFGQLRGRPVGGQHDAAPAVALVHHVVEIDGAAGGQGLET